MARRTLFLPGAGGSAGFWTPCAAAAGLEGTFLSWPGLGDEPTDPAIASISDLVALTLSHMDEPVDIVAQSMGGYVALRAALAAPDKVGRLVLAVTSGGLPMADLGASDWRSDYFDAFPTAAGWIADPAPGLDGRLGTVTMPTLLLWGDNDPISPVAVGRQLARQLPDAHLQIIEGGGHDLARTHIGLVAPLIAAHLQR